MSAYFPHRKNALPRATRSGIDRVCELARTLLVVDRVLVVGSDDARLGGSEGELTRRDDELVTVGRFALDLDGKILGSLVVAHAGERPLSAAEQLTLTQLAAMVVDQLRAQEQEEDLQQQAALLRQTERLAQTGGWVVDFEHGTALWSEELYRLHEADPTEPVTFQSLMDFYPNGHAERLDAEFKQAIATGRGFELDLEYRTRSGRTKWARILAEVELTPGVGPRVLGTFRDLTAQHEAEAGLRNATFHDSVTGLFNRKRLDVRLDELCEAGERGAVVLVGLDNFKALNEARGRNVGDAFLQNVGERLVTKLSSDSFLARIGGDEFAVLLPGVHD
ncbi:diguanylate cyclase, partial [bacterium]